jgi:hypothetical protein
MALMTTKVGARETEMRALRERQATARERATKRPTVAPMSPSDRVEYSTPRGVVKQVQPPPPKPPTQPTAKAGVTGEARRAAPTTGTLPVGAAPNIRDEQMSMAFPDGPPCVHCDLPMLRNPQSKSKTFGRAWLCPVCDSDKLPAAPPVDNGTDVVDEAVPQEEESEVAKKKLKKAVKMAKKVKAKKQTAKIIKKVKTAVLKAKVKNGVGRPKGHAADSIEAAAPWEKIGVSRRTYFRYKLEGKLTADGSALK